MKKIALVCVAVILAVTAGAVGMRAFAASPGTDGDPLISLSYIQDTLIPQIYGYVDAKIAGTSAQPEAATYKVVRVDAGQSLVATSEGVEIVLRSGAAKAIVSKSGGIADLTKGIDLKKDENIEKNHHILVPLPDGRGVTAVTDIVVMVKGGFKVSAN